MPLLPSDALFPLLFARLMGGLVRVAIEPAAGGGLALTRIAATGILLVLTGGLAGGAALLERRRRRARVTASAPPPGNTLAALVERTHCLLWSARVELSPTTTEWDFTLYPTALAQRLFGRLPLPKQRGLWDQFNLPEQAEMDRRARDAMERGLPGYEQYFSVVRHEEVWWMHESVSITRTGPTRFWMGGLVTDVTVHWRAEQAKRASEAQLQQLLNHANCMLWQARVRCDEQGDFHWDWYVPRSELYRQMMGEADGSRPIMPWGLINVPEFPELEARSRQAMREGLAGYEQEFRVIKDGDTRWMHEQVAIVGDGDRRWKLEGVVIDVTAQKLAEEARRTADTRLGNLLRLADCMVWEASVVRHPDGRCEWSHFMPRSALYRRIFGETEEVRLLWHTLNVPELDAMTARANRALASGEPGYTQEFRVLQASGTLWLREVVNISRAGPDRFRLVGVVTDITARREAETARRHSEGRLKNLLARADCFLWEATVELKEWKWAFEIQDSELCRRLYGRPGAGVSAGLWREFEIPEWTEMNRRCRTALETGQPGYEQVFQLPQPDREPTWIQENVTIQALGDGRFSLVGVVTDITRRQGAELALAAEKERLAVTLRAMAEAVITMDVAGRILFVNHAAALLTQWPGEAAVGQLLVTVCRFEHSHSGAAVEMPLARVALGDAVADLPPQTRLVGRAGRHRLVEGCYAPIHGSDSRVTGLVLVFRDVTEQDRLEQELIRATRLESVGILAGGIAHDFNNILTGVMGNLMLAKLGTKPDSEVGERLAEAEKATLRARDLTQQLLTFAKGGEPVRAAVHLGALLQETTRFALHGARVKADFDLAPDLWPADADKGQIGRVVQNLVINAVQAMPAGGTVRVSAHNETVGAAGQAPRLDPGPYVCIAIADTGAGISPETLDRIFEPYFTTKTNGSGLGLAAVHSIVRKHRGQIDVASQPGVGTTFRLWLPAAREALGPAGPPPGASPPRFSGRVLFMDDEEIIRALAARLLSQLGFEVDCTAGGAETVEKFQNARAAGRPYTLVIMDLTVPGGYGGREAIGHLRAIDPAVRAIVSSGYSSDPVLANYRQHGFSGVMAKPYQLAELVAAIRQALGS